MLFSVFCSYKCEHSRACARVEFLGGGVYISSTSLSIFHQIISQSSWANSSSNCSFSWNILPTFGIIQHFKFANLLAVYLYLTEIFIFISLVNNKISIFLYVYGPFMLSLLGNVCWRLLPIFLLGLCFPPFELECLIFFFFWTQIVYYYMCCKYFYLICSLPFSLSLWCLLLNASFDFNIVHLSISFF